MHVRSSRASTRGSSPERVKADEMRLGPLLGGPRQYVVPYFQRTYSWRRRQWITLWDDILELYELGSTNSHFLGSMVLLAEDSTAQLVIAGRPRSVTMSLVVRCLR